MSTRIDRRTVVKGGLGAGLALTLASAVRSQDDPATLRPKEGDLLVRMDDPALKPIAAADVTLAAPQVMAWTMDPALKVVRNGSRLNRVMLLRLDEAKLSPDTRARAAAGVVAYSAICTHTGCDVSEWLGDEGVLHCPCHFSKYDPKDGGAVLDGPAPRPLSALPLRITDGQLVVAGPFNLRVTFDPA